MGILISKKVLIPTASILAVVTIAFVALYISNLKKTGEELEKEINTLNKDNKNLEKINESVEKQNKSLGQEVDKKEGTIKKNKKDLEEKQKKIKDKNDTINQKNSEIKSLKEAKAKKKDVELAKEANRNLVATSKKQSEGISKPIVTKSANNQDRPNKKPKTKPNNSVKSTHNMEATHYTAFCDTGCTGVTATGKDVSNTTTHNGKKVIAVDPNVIPLGSDVRITSGSNSYIATAQDTGGDIKGNRIDILVASKSEARSLGRTGVKVEVLN